MMNLKIMEDRAIPYKIIPAWVASGSVSRLRLEDELNAQTDKGISFDFSLNRSGQSVAGKHPGLGGQGE